MIGPTITTRPTRSQFVGAQSIQSNEIDQHALYLNL
jgi:hypothetical protein